MKEKGLTLLEVLLTLLIIAILVNGIALRFNSSEDRVRQKADTANRMQIEGAMDLYKLDTGQAPKNIDDLLIKPPGVRRWRGPYLDHIPDTLNAKTTYKLDDQGKVVENETN